MARVLRISTLVIAAFLGAGFTALAQEVVLFKDYRSLIVQSHRVVGSWTYLRVGTGEMAVPSSSVLQVEKEQAQAAPVVSATQPGPAPVAMPPRPEPSLVRQPLGAPPLPPADPDEDEDDEEADDESDMADEPPPPPPPPPPSPPKNPLGAGLVARPQPLQQPQVLQPQGH